MIFIRRPRMQDMCVGQELYISDIENHVQGETHACVFEDLCRAFLFWRERGDEAGGGEAGEGADVVWIPPK